jgi:hypothetical protein
MMESRKHGIQGSMERHCCAAAFKASSFEAESSSCTGPAWLQAGGLNFHEMERDNFYLPVVRCRAAK